MILFCDSFSAYATADLPTRWKGYTPVGASIVNTVLPPSSQAGAQVYHVVNNAQGITSDNYGAKTELVLAFRCNKVTTTGSIVYPVHQIAFGNYGFPCGLAADALGTYFVNDGGAVIKSGPVIPIDEWHHYELHMIFNTAGAGSIVLYLDGNPAPFMSLTGISTSYAQAEAFSLGGNGPSNHGINGLEAYFADFYAFDNTGAAPFNAPLAPQGFGAAKMAFAVPNGPGHLSAWTPNGAATIWQCINQIPQDGDTTYASDATPGDAYMVTFGALPAMQTLLAVQLSVYAREDDAGPRSYQSGFSNGTTDGYSGVDQYLGGTYNYIQDEFPINPVTGIAWAPGDLATLQFGAKLTH